VKGVDWVTSITDRPSCTCVTDERISTLATITVSAKDHATRVGLVDAAARYRIESTGHWTDWWVKTDALGYTSKAVQALFEKFRIVPNARWFALCGVLAPPTANNDEVLNLVRTESFDLSPFIATEDWWVPSQTAILFVFPNDVYSAYWNNSGAIEIAVTRELA